MPVIEGLGRLLLPEADASFADATQESPAKVGHVASMIESFQKSEGGQSDCSQSPCRKKTTTSGHFRDGSVRAEDILELTNRLAHVEARQHYFSEQLQLLQAAAADAAAEQRVQQHLVETSKRLEVMEVNGSDLRLRLEALEQQLCKDVVLQSSALQAMQNQLGELHQQLSRSVATELELRLTQEAETQQRWHQRLAAEVQDQVRREYRRMALELTEQSPGSRGFGRGTRASPAEFSMPKASAEFSKGAEHALPGQTPSSGRGDESSAAT
ncbi:unnamed protein product [Cladocopium goreaui]|uniref:Uncharacterized protein n=1 Tax=Cladocopium goreaui TaxID=2562237 RepID=A0A9P1FVN4_9DINO|nr:unnamed protein product [Cladocopium goreaui]CAI4002986.1 unnamed protein product [Cladocopium goreaui]